MESPVPGGAFSGHRDPVDQNAFACTAPGAGQHRDYVKTISFRGIIQ